MVQKMIRLGYWNIRGLAQPIRYMLEYSGVPWQDELYIQAGPDASVPYDKSCWFSVKETLGLPFPNLPYAIHGDIKLSQSQAILRYVAGLKPELKLAGESLEERANVDQILAEFADCKGKMTTLQYTHGISGPSVDFVFGEGFDCLPKTIDRFASFLGDKPWFAGSRITMADFVMFEYLACTSLFVKAVAAGASRLITSETHAGFDRSPNLVGFVNRFGALPPIASYLSSERFRAVSAMNNQHAKFR